MQSDAPQRKATAILQLPQGDTVVEAIVDLTAEPATLISWEQVPRALTCQAAALLSHGGLLCPWLHDDRCLWTA